MGEHQIDIPAQGGGRQHGGQDLSAIPDPAVRAVFQSHGEPIRSALLELRELILKSAASTDGVGALSETLKWGQPSYRPAKAGVGTTVRIDRDKSAPDAYAVYVHCQTGLIDTFRDLYPNTFRFAGNRALVFRTGEEVPEAELSHCVALALTYHQRKRAR